MYSFTKLGLLQLKAIVFSFIRRDFSAMYLKVVKVTLQVQISMFDGE